MRKVIVRFLREWADNCRLDALGHHMSSWYIPPAKPTPTQSFHAGWARQGDAWADRMNRLADWLEPRGTPCER